MLNWSTIPKPSLKPFPAFLVNYGGMRLRGGGRRNRGCFAGGGDEMGQTFEELIGLHLDGLYSAALCFTLDEHRAEELLQEASIRAFHELSWQRGAAEFRLVMLERLVTTHLQRQRRAGRDPLAAAGAPQQRNGGESLRGLKPFPQPGTPGHVLLRSWMRGAWLELDDGDRLILWLADVERIRHPVVAKMIGIDVEEVRNRHYRARSVLSRGAADQLSRGLGGAEVS